MPKSATLLQSNGLIPEVYTESLCDAVADLIHNTHDLPLEPAERVLSTQVDAIAQEVLESLRMRSRAVEELITTTVFVEENPSLEQILKFIGWELTVEKGITIPRWGDGGTMKVALFRTAHYTNNYALKREHQIRSLRGSADPRTFIRAIVKNPVHMPACIHWEDAKGWCVMEVFGNGKSKKTRVFIHRENSGKEPIWWHVGVPI